MMLKQQSWILGARFSFWDGKIYASRFQFMPHMMPTENHEHAELEVHCLTSGRKRMILNFEHECLLTPGQVLLIGPGVFHEEQPIEEPAAGYCLSLVLDGESNPLSAQSYRQLQDTEGLLESFSHLMQELQEEKLAYQEVARGLLSVICGKLLRLCGNGGKEDKAVADAEIKRYLVDGFFNRIFHHETEGYTPDLLAQQLHISVRHLNRVLHTLYGMGFNEKLTYTRLKYAEYQLLHTEETVEKISEECTWSATYLIRAFKKRYGVTPLQFRKNHTKRT